MAEFIARIGAAEKTRALQKGDPNRRPDWLVTKKPKSGEFCFGTFWGILLWH